MGPSFSSAASSPPGPHSRASARMAFLASLFIAYTSRMNILSPLVLRTACPPCAAHALSTSHSPSWSARAPPSHSRLQYTTPPHPLEHGVWAPSSSGTKHRWHTASWYASLTTHAIGSALSTHSPALTPLLATKHLPTSRLVSSFMQEPAPKMPPTSPSSPAPAAPAGGAAGAAALVGAGAHVDGSVAGFLALSLLWLTACFPPPPSPLSEAMHPAWLGCSFRPASNAARASSLRPRATSASPLRSYPRTKLGSACRHASQSSSALWCSPSLSIQRARLLCRAATPEEGWRTRAAV
mmetsp:Transcript_55092/g.133400  ORF Transcript_55092/g.133400 Transcript_55092/m.133400 type:complete len:296 (-) Transcript_55092:765-1652(-)